MEHVIFSDDEEQEEYDSSDSGSDDAGDGDGGEKRFHEAGQGKTLEGDLCDDDVGGVGCQAHQDNDDHDNGGERDQADRAEESTDRFPDEVNSANRGSVLAFGSGGRAEEGREADTTPTVPSCKAPAYATRVPTVIASSKAPPKRRVKNLNGIQRKDQSKRDYAEWSAGFESDDDMPADTSTTLCLPVDNADELEWYAGFDDHGTSDEDDAWSVEGDDSPCSGGMGDGDPWGEGGSDTGEGNPWEDE